MALYLVTNMQDTVRMRAVVAKRTQNQEVDGLINKLPMESPRDQYRYAARKMLYIFYAINFR
jgi:hypothetical protein